MKTMCDFFWTLSIGSLPYFYYFSHGIYLYSGPKFRAFNFILWIMLMLIEMLPFYLSFVEHVISRLSFLLFSIFSKHRECVREHQPCIWISNIAHCAFISNCGCFTFEAEPWNFKSRCCSVVITLNSRYGCECGTICAVWFSWEFE